MELREDYQKLMEKQLNEWKAQTERFRADAEKIEAQNKAQYKKSRDTAHRASGCVGELQQVERC